MKFTFKTIQGTGRYRSFLPHWHEIKIKNVVVGYVVDETWKIRLMVEKTYIFEDDNPNCSWKWITLKKQSTSLQEAKDFLNDNFVNITKKWDLHIEKKEVSK